MRVPAKTRPKARDRYTRFLQLSLYCLTDAIWIVGPRLLGGLGLTTSRDPVELRTQDGGRLFLSAGQAFHYDRHPNYQGEWKVFTDEYAYHVRYSADPADDFLAWHWHPDVRPECHLHVYGAEFAGGRTLEKKHVPTARVSFEEVSRFLIEELDVVPRQDNWRDVLLDSQTRFELFRSWAGSRRPEDVESEE